MQKPIDAFIDASNIIYGTRTKQGQKWNMDYEKLYEYLRGRYGVEKIFYFGGIEQHKEKQQRFYDVLRRIGYVTVLKPVIYHSQPDGSVIRKANCDVDLTFYAMRTVEEYSGIILMSGDGDFYILLEYLLQEGKTVHVIANRQRTAQAIRRLLGSNFMDINSLQQPLQYKNKED